MSNPIPRRFPVIVIPDCGKSTQVIIAAGIEAYQKIEAARLAAFLARFGG